jgi:hypothetical protein
MALGRGRSVLCSVTTNRLIFIFTSAQAKGGFLNDRTSNNSNYYGLSCKTVDFSEFRALN